MKILAIESSCDETAAAVVENGTIILSSVVASSSDLHQKTGGVIPEIAAREQLKCIVPVINQALEKSNRIPYTLARRSSSLKNEGGVHRIPDIDAIAVTYGPGLIGSLLIGVETAKTLAYIWNKPLIPVNHLVGHLYANWLEEKNSIPYTVNRKPSFPALAMVISGGHTDMVLMTGHGKINYIGGTRDDAAGECFDKTARLLGLAMYNGGPAIATAAEKYEVSQKPHTLARRSSSLKNEGGVNRTPYTIHLPRPMIDTKDFDFSFSGLKTAVLREVNTLKSNNNFNEEAINRLAYEVQEAITDVIVSKLIKAVNKYRPASLLLAGGVSANSRLKEKLENAVSRIPYTVNPYIPPSKLCTDNAAYIASCAYFNYHPVPFEKINADPSLTIVQ